MARWWFQLETLGAARRPRQRRALEVAVVAGWALAVVGCGSSAPANQQLLDRIATALGGKDRVLEIASLRLEGTGETYSLGQNRTVQAELPKYTVSNVVRRLDFARNRSRLEQQRTPAFPTGNPAAVRQFIALDGDVAFVVSEAGVVTRQEPWVARERRAELRHTPTSIVRAALASGSTLSAPRIEDDQDAIDITETDGATFTLFSDRATHLPTRVRSMTTHPNLGDTTVETLFENYGTTNGVQTPSVYVTKMDGQIISRLQVSSTTLNAGVEDLVAPPPVVSSDPNPPRATVTVEEVGPGLWYLTGQSHHSVVVEFADHLTLVEAPLSEARTLAVIQKARELRPGKPVTEVIPSHHHFDHIAGIRAAVSEGLTLVTPTRTRAHYEQLISRPHTLLPDALARAPKPPQFRTFDDELTLEDKQMSLRVVPIGASAHAEPFLAVYFPKHRALYEVDAFTPAAADAKTPPPSPFAAQLRDAVVTRGLRVDTLLPGHGRKATWRELEAAATATPAP